MSQCAVISRHSHPGSAITSMTGSLHSLRGARRLATVASLVKDQPPASASVLKSALRPSEHNAAAANNDSRL